MMGFMPMRNTSHLGFNQAVARTPQRVGYFANTVIAKTSSIPEGLAPSALLLPLTAGGMAARSYARMAASADMLNGGPMQADATMAFTSGTPSMSLVISMSAPWVGAFTPTASLRLTIGMEATFACVFAANGNMAMIVPMGSASFTAAFTGAATMHGRLSMEASFGGAEPLSPEGLANAVWEAAAADHNNAGTMGAKLNAAGAASDPWATPEGQAVVNNTGLIPAIV